MSHLKGFSAAAGSTIIQPETEGADENLTYAVPFIHPCPGSNQWQLRMAKAKYT